MGGQSGEPRGGSSAVVPVAASHELDLEVDRIAVAEYRRVYGDG